MSASLGAVTAFMSHAWVDSASPKYAALKRYAVEREKATGNPTSLWLDKACLDQNNISASLLCLPVYLAYCEQLLVLAGPCYSTRLWCVLEIFTFSTVRPTVDGSIDSLTIRPFDDTGELAEDAGIKYFSSFDAGKATCFLRKDREHLLSVIESGYGSIPAFNRKVRRIVAELPAAVKRRERSVAVPPLAVEVRP